MLRLLLPALLLLAACAAEEGPPQPLTALEIRSRVFGRMMEATDPKGGRYFIRFQDGNTAEIIGDTREFVRWYAGTPQGLCLQPHDGPVHCAPLYQLGVAHFAWGDTRLTDFTVRRPEFFGHDQSGAFPER